MMANQRGRKRQRKTSLKGEGAALAFGTRLQQGSGRRNRKTEWKILWGSFMPVRRSLKLARRAPERPRRNQRRNQQEEGELGQEVPVARGIKNCKTFTRRVNGRDEGEARKVEGRVRVFRQ